MSQRLKTGINNMLRFQKGITFNNRFYPLDVEILNFLSHGLNENLIKELVIAISRFNKIKTLNLGENEMTDAVIPTICEHLLKEGSSLKRLDLGGNQITENGAKLLLEALRKNSRLVELFLRGNPRISNNTLDAIQEILDANKSRQFTLTTI